MVSTSDAEAAPPAAKAADATKSLPYSHRRTAGELKRCKKLERTDIDHSAWGHGGYAKRGDVLSQKPPVVAEDGSQTRPIPRVRRADITPEWFQENVATAKQPMIVEGACSDWPAMSRWSIPDLEKRFRHVSFKVGSDKKGRKVKLKLKYFADYVQCQQDDNPLYLFETAVEENAEMSSLMQDYKVPDLFPCDWFGLVNRDARPPFRWFCIGPKRSGTPVHTDPLGTAAWNAVTHGAKRWVLFEPGTSKRLVKGKDLLQKGEDDEAVHYFDFILPRIKASYPDVRIYEGLQGPGDVIFVPGDWWHGVLNVEDCVAVTQNYVGPDNFETVWKRTRREREKVAYLWLRNMRKFAPELHHWATELNRLDGFRMRHERGPDEKLSSARSNSTDSSSSDSSSDKAEDVCVPESLHRIAAAASSASLAKAAEAAAEGRSGRRSPASGDGEGPRRKRRKRGGWDLPPVSADAAAGAAAAAAMLGTVAPPPEPVAS